MSFSLARALRRDPNSARERPPGAILYATDPAPHTDTHTAACTGYSPQGFLFSRAFGGPFGLSSRPPCRVLPHCCAADRFHRSTFGISLCTHSPVPYYPHTVALLCVSFYHCCSFRVKSFVDRLLISAEHHGGNSYYLYGGLERKLPWSFGSSRIFAV